MDIPAGIAAQSALTRQTIALSVIKAASDADKQLAGILEAAIANVPVSSSRGTSLNLQA